MSAFIKLNKQDAFVTSYVAHKSWAVNSSSLSEYGIEVLRAVPSPTSSVVETYTDLRYSTYVLPNDGTFDQWDSIINEYPGGRSLIPGYFDIEYNQSTGVPIRGRIRELDVNSIDISGQVGNWTFLEYRLNIGGTTQIRSGSITNVVQENGTFTFDIIGGSQDPYVTVSSQVNPKPLEPTPQFINSSVTVPTMFNPNSSATTGVNGDQYRDLVYSSIKHLYYSGVYTGNPPSSSYEEYSQTTLYPSSSRTLGDEALVITIPQDIFGNAIKPGTFSIGSSIPLNTYVSGGFVQSGYFITVNPVDYNVYDNGEGVLVESGSLRKVGDIIYTHGLAIITDTGSINSILNLTGSCTPISPCPTSSYVNVGFVSGSYFVAEDCSGNFYVHPGFVSASYLVGSSGGNSSSSSQNCLYSYNILWQSTKDIYTHNYRCRVRESDLNYSQNPSTKSGSNGDLYDFATGSYFQPYVTTVGLYNDSNELIGIGKLGQPVPKSQYTDMTFVVKLDI